MSIKGAPSWVNEGNQALKDGNRRFFRGVGQAPNMNDFSLQTSTADNRARAEVAQIFSSFMDIANHDYSATTKDDMALTNEQIVSRTIQNLTKLNLSGVQIIARWKNPKTGDIYSLAELDLKQFKTVSQTTKTMDANIQKYLNNNAQSIFDTMIKGK